MKYPHEHELMRWRDLKLHTLDIASRGYYITAVQAWRTYNGIENARKITPKTTSMSYSSSTQNMSG